MNRMYAWSAIAAVFETALSFGAALEVGAGKTYTDIASAVAAAQSGDTIQIDAGTYFVNTALTLGNVKIIGAGRGQTIITRDGQNYKNQKLFILTDAGALVDNLTVKDVYAQDVGGTSGCIFEFPNTTGAGKISRLVVECCTAGSSGAGYICYIGQNASAEVEDVIFRNNSMRDSGGSGVIYANRATSAKITNCAFIHNTGFTTGAIRIMNNCEVAGCTFADNRTNYTVPANARGGAVYMEGISNKKTILTNCVFFADHAWYDATPVAPEVYYSAINATLTNCFFDCAWDAKVPAIGKGAISITEGDFTDVYSGDFRPHANSALIREGGITRGYFAASDATGPAYTPTGPAEITLSLNDSINEAIHAAPEGQVINLAEGIYSVTGTLWIAKGITLRGAGMDKTFLMRAGSTYNSTPYLRLEHPGAVVSGVTISNVTATANNQAGVLFIAAQGGEFKDSRITKSKGGGSGTGATIGVAGKGWIHHSILNANTVNGASGESIIYMWGGVLDNCLACKNTYITEGCVSMRGNGKISNCTFADNVTRNDSTARLCAGIFWKKESSFDPTGSRIVNTIFTRGTAEKDTSEGAPEWYNKGGTAAQFTNCFSHCGWGSGVPVIGAGSVAVSDDGFVDAANGDYHLKTTSAAYEKGADFEGIAATDLDGNDRVQGDFPDIGCFEAAAGQLTAGIKVVPTEGFVGETFHCTPIINGMPDGKSFTCQWMFRNENVSETDIVSTESECDQTFASAGTRSVYLAVYDEGGQLLVEAEPELNYLRIGVRTNFVAAADDASATPAFPYDTPQTAAKTNLAALVAEAIPGQTIVLGKGSFDAGGLLDLSGLRVVGRGWDETVVTNAPLAAQSESYSQECFIKLNQAGSLLDNLCISNVITYFNNGSLITIGAAGGTVSRVKVVGCRGGYSANGFIAGLYGPNSLLTRCIFKDCTVQENGKCGCIFAENGSKIDNTLVDGTHGLCIGGGIIAEGQMTEIRNCTVVRNHIGTTALFRPNATATGFVFWNHNDVDVGSKFVNCVAACNETPPNVGDGGSAWQGSKETVRAFCVSNCAFSADAALTGANCLLVDDVSRAFRDIAEGDWRLRSGSPLIDSGVNEIWSGDALDLLGNPRVFHGLVDIGCYERQETGTVFIIR